MNGDVSGYKGQVILEQVPEQPEGDTSWSSIIENNLPFQFVIGDPTAVFRDAFDLIPCELICK